MQDLHQPLIDRIYEWVDPSLELSLAASGAKVSLLISDDQATVNIVLTYPSGGAVESLRHFTNQLLESALPHLTLSVNVSHKIIVSDKAKQGNSLDNIKHLIAITSGKGGVGKSTTALNIALALQYEGASVGILDADIYGPSLPMMLGVSEQQRPEVKEQKFFMPIEALGLQTMSMGYLVTEKTPMVWRGPMVSGALTQIINQTLWPELDYLIIDMPPGTGDIHLTLSQQIPVSGSVVVTTPQDLALLDAKKGIEMFRKVDVPCLGVIENMSTHICSQCSHEEAIFGEGGGEAIASEYDVSLLGSIPLSFDLRKGLDHGQPIMAVLPEGSLSMQYRQIALKLAIRLQLEGQSSTATIPDITITDD
tara:strand:+ start:2274 stop:3368 length:1095 start_codon:yes stop_codon:yes gene_type:complete